MLKAPVRMRTDFTCGAVWTYRNPSVIAARIVRTGSATCGARFHVYKKRITPKNDAAFNRNDQPDPAAATTIPPSAGPTARATLNPAEFNATADAWRCGEITSGVIACHAGSFITAPTPIRNVNRSSIQGLTAPSRVKAPRMAAASTIQLWVK